MISKRVTQWLSGLALILFLAAGTLSAEELPRVLDSTGPSAAQRIISKTVSNLVNGGHLANKLDDEASRRGFEQFLLFLDPRKVYFRQSDLDSWGNFEESIDDVINSGKIDFAYIVFRRYSERLAELMPEIHRLIDEEHDFTLDETIVIDRDELDYPKTKEEAIDRIRRQIKYNILVLKSNDDTLEEAREALHRRFRMEQRNAEQTDVFELLGFFLTAATTGLDPHTTYLPPRDQDNFNITIGLNLEGIGAQLTPDDGYTKVASVVPGGAADLDGRLQAGDRIVAVRQDDEAEPVDVVEMKLDDVVSLIRGNPNSVVHLTVEKADTKEREIYSITRAKIELTEEKARSVVLQRGQKPNGDPYKLGFVNLPSFYLDMEAARNNVPNFRSTTRDMRSLLKEFKTQGVDAVVLDLSRNGGGSLVEAISMTGLFIDKGPVVQVKNSRGQVLPYEDEESGVEWDGPLVVLTSKMSASASEIFAGAIQDYERGIVVGDPKTHGKGTVQTLLNVSDFVFRGNKKAQFGALKLTIQQFYLPDGASTQLDGVSADVILPSILQHRDIGEDDLDYALPADNVPARPHVNYGMVSPTIRANLQKQSAERISSSDDFDKLLKRIELFVDQKEQKEISLNETVFMKRQKTFEALEDEEAGKELTDEEREEIRRKIFRDSPYNEEILNISVDYIKTLRELNLARAG